MAGVFLSGLGLSLPWFKLMPDAQWAYQGWQLMQYEGLPWIGLIFGAYGLLLLAGLFFFQRGPAIVASIAILSLVITLATSLVVTLAIADIVPGGGRHLDNLTWSFGLIVLIPGQVLLVLSACAGWVLSVIRHLARSR